MHVFWLLLCIVVILNFNLLSQQLIDKWWITSTPWCGLTNMLNNMFHRTMHMHVLLIIWTLWYFRTDNIRCVNNNGRWLNITDNTEHYLQKRHKNTIFVFGKGACHRVNLWIYALHVQLLNLFGVIYLLMRKTYVLGESGS